MNLKIKNIEDLVLSIRLFNVCIGVLLGDASLQKNTSKAKKKYRLKLLQGAKNKDYIYHLHHEFKAFVLSPPFFDSKRNTYSFQTVFHSEFKRLADIFLINKDLPTRKSIGSYFFREQDL